MNILEKYVRRGHRTASRIWGNTAVVVLLPLRENKFEETVFELSKNGTYIWRQLEKKPKVKELIKHFAKRKQVSFGIAAKEVLKFIKKLAAEKIIDILDEIDKD